MGTNTVASTSVVATIGLVTSAIALRAASSLPSPIARWRCTFSTTTIASSTTIPIERTSPNSDNVLREKPSRWSTASVPTIETGTASTGMSAARQTRRNTITTRITSKTASISVCETASSEARTNRVGS